MRGQEQKGDKGPVLQGSDLAVYIYDSRMNTDGELRGQVSGNHSHAESDFYRKSDILYFS